MWFGISTFWLTFVVCVQVLMLVLLFKAYKVIKYASRTLGIQNKDQTNQLCLMIFCTILLAVSYLVWYICDFTAYLMAAIDRIDLAQVLFIESCCRLLRICCQQFALTWILISFQKYGTKVDEKIEKHKARQSIKLAR